MKQFTRIFYHYPQEFTRIFYHYPQEFTRIFYHYPQEFTRIFYHYPQESIRIRLSASVYPHPRFLPYPYKQALNRFCDVATIQNLDSPL